MRKNVLDLSQSPLWYRRLLNAHWLFSAVILLTEIIEMYYRPAMRDSILRHDVLLQGAFLLGIPALMEILCLFKRYRSDYTLITGCYALTITLVLFHREVILLPILLLVPVSVAILSFKKSRILYAGALGLPIFVGMALAAPDLAILQHQASMVTFLGYYMSLLFMSYWFVSRCEEMLDHLDDAHSAHQELLVKNIIMDKLFKMDALTELYNHKTFHEYLEKLIEQSETNGLPLQLAILDLDHFKKVNDTYGHHVGDHVLMRTAAILRQSVTANDFVARYGGEEFAIIFTEKSLKESYAVLERIRQEMENTLHEELGFRSVTCSIGVEAYMPGTGKDYLFKNADASLYAAKKRGRNQISTTGSIDTADALDSVG